MSAPSLGRSCARACGRRRRVRDPVRLHAAGARGGAPPRRSDCSRAATSTALPQPSPAEPCGSARRRWSSTDRPSGWRFRCVRHGCPGERDLGADPARAVELLTESGSLSRRRGRPRARAPTANLRVATIPSCGARSCPAAVEGIRGPVRGSADSDRRTIREHAAGRVLPLADAGADLHGSPSPRWPSPQRLDGRRAHVKPTKRRFPKRPSFA